MTDEQIVRLPVPTTCRACLKEIVSGARKCSECGAMQGIIGLLGTGSLLLSLVISLVTALALLGPLILGLFEGPEFGCNVVVLKVTPGNFHILITNTGNRAFVVSQMMYLETYGFDDIRDEEILAGQYPKGRDFSTSIRPMELDDSALDLIEPETAIILRPRIDGEFPLLVSSDEERSGYQPFLARGILTITAVGSDGGEFEALYGFDCVRGEDTAKAIASRLTNTSPALKEELKQLRLVGEDLLDKLGGQTQDLVDEDGDGD